LKEYHALATVQEDLKNGSISCVNLVQSYLDKIEARKNLNAYLEVFAEEAKERAQQIDKKIASGTAGRLAGMVIAIKDNICYKGHVVTASSKILEGFESLFSATVVERLLAEDAIILGRLNCDEFAMGSSNENSAYGNVLNPVNEKMVPGGSSGGAAVAVKAGLCLAALGSDTGGSIRQPASFCGTIGLKPTYGRVSRYGLLAYASSFDQIGPFTHTVDDAALLLEIMAGTDDYDSTSSQEKVDPYSEQLEYTGTTKIAYIKDCLERPGLDPEIKAKMESVIEGLRKEGHTVEAVDFPYLDYLVPAYYVLTTAEASSNLARYDGIHYGHRSDKAVEIDSTFKFSRTEGFGKEVKRRIVLGTFVLSAGYYDAYYTKGHKTRRIIQDKTNDILKEYEFILLPTCPTTAFEIGKNVDDPITMYLQDIFTVQANLAGIPAVSLPMGEHSNGMPFGVQVMAKSFDEAKMLAFSKTLMNNHS
jgi:aspartyl-tRNA(Asn)/glutamyl-tRNA(Gln) amidotransferase subunit A